MDDLERAANRLSSDAANLLRGIGWETLTAVEARDFADFEFGLSFRLGRWPRWEPDRRVYVSRCAPETWTCELEETTYDVSIGQVNPDSARMRVVEHFVSRLPRHALVEWLQASYLLSEPLAQPAWWSETAQAEEDDDVDAVEVLAKFEAWVESLRQSKGLRPHQPSQAA